MSSLVSRKRAQDKSKRKASRHCPCAACCGNVFFPLRQPPLTAPVVPPLRSTHCTTGSHISASSGYIGGFFRIFCPCRFQKRIRYRRSRRGAAGVGGTTIGGVGAGGGGGGAGAYIFAVVTLGQGLTSTAGSATVGVAGTISSPNGGATTVQIGSVVIGLGGGFAGRNAVSNTWLWRCGRCSDESSLLRVCHRISTRRFRGKWHGRRSFHRRQRWRWRRSSRFAFL